MTTQTAMGQAAALRDRAARHKWAERQHRRRARQAMEELREFCLRHNITLDIAPQEAESHEQRRRS